MRKTLMVLATAATVAVGAVAAPTGAEARHWGGPGLIGGLVLGGLVAGALAPRYYGYPGYRYGAYRGYDYDDCWRRHWNGWRWVGYRVC
jgi:hypothetical protein